MRRAGLIAFFLSMVLMGSVGGAWAQAQAPGSSAQSACGHVEWHTPEREPLRFDVKSTAGVYVASSDQFVLSFFADALTPEQRSHWVSHQASVLGGPRFVSQPELDASVRDAMKRSVMVWGKVSDMLHDKAQRPAEVLQAADVTGVAFCVGSLCNLYSGGVTMQPEEGQTPAVRMLRVPLTAQCVEQGAGIDADIIKSPPGEPVKRALLCGSVPMQIVVK